MNEPRRHRLQVDLDEEQWKGIENIRWGMKRALFCAVIDQLIPLLKNYPEATIGGLMSGKLKIKIAKAEEGEKDG